jgi:hypothetical protein
MELTLRRPSGTYNFEVAPRILENLYNPVLLSGSTGVESFENLLSRTKMETSSNFTATFHRQV